MSLRGWRQRAGPSGLPQFFREKLTKSFITAAAGNGCVEYPFMCAALLDQWRAARLHL